MSRVLITKRDNGSPTVNLALLSSNLAGSALTQIYYPHQNRNVDQVLTTFGTSLGGSAVSDLLGEFLTQTAERLHLK